MKAILGFLMVFGFNVAQADSANLCDNEVVMQAMQKVMESLDAETLAIAGKSLTAQQPTRVTAGAQDATGLSVDTFAVVIQLTNADTNIAYNVQMDVTFENAKGTCDYIKKTTKISIQ